MNVDRKRIIIATPVKFWVPKHSRTGKKIYRYLRHLPLDHGFLDDRFCLLAGGRRDIRDELTKVHGLSSLDKKQERIVVLIRSVGVRLFTSRARNDYTLSLLTHHAVRELKISAKELMATFGVTDFNILCAIAGLPKFKEESA
ncbi:hypothetical protein HN958_00095 [Candidatus Falkowbacteria bacterium]|jgi:hypothetical protein|nr:hypothetical protein [Candidatus Falkowbacteria bacterium]MBT7006888.1 hypothetical protein [Candidatus Falkowbacteria bacterium]